MRKFILITLTLISCSSEVIKPLINDKSEKQLITSTTPTSIPTNITNTPTINISPVLQLPTVIPVSSPVNTPIKKPIETTKPLENPSESISDINGIWKLKFTSNTSNDILDVKYYALYKSEDGLGATELINSDDLNKINPLSWTPKKDDFNGSMYNSYENGAISFKNYKLLMSSNNTLVGYTNFHDYIEGEKIKTSFNIADSNNIIIKTCKSNPNNNNKFIPLVYGNSSGIWEITTTINSLVSKEIISRKINYFAVCEEKSSTGNNIPQLRVSKIVNKDEFNPQDPLTWTPKRTEFNDNSYSGERLNNYVSFSTGFCVYPVLGIDCASFNYSFIFSGDQILTGDYDNSKIEGKRIKNSFDIIDNYSGNINTCSSLDQTTTPKTPIPIPTAVKTPIPPLITPSPLKTPFILITPTPTPIPLVTPNSLNIYTKSINNEYSNF